MLVYPFFLYALISVFKTVNNAKLKSVYAGSIVLLIFYSVVLSSQLGTIFKNNEEYDSFIAQSVANDIMRDNPKQTPIVVASGNRVSPKNWLIYEKFPFFNDIGQSTWHIFSIHRYIDTDLSILGAEQEYTKDKCEMDVLTKTPIYHLRKRDSVYVVHFNYKDCDDA